MENALENPVVLRNLFAYLPLPDLLECSLINRQWNYEVKSYVRDFRKCIAQVEGSLPCESLEWLNQDLDGISNDIVPYNGLSLYICEHDPGRCKGDATLHGKKSFIKDKWKGKLWYLKIKWSDFDSTGGLSCPCSRMVPIILSNNAETLEKLVFDEIPSDFLEEFNELFDNAIPSLKNGTFAMPNLKILRLGSGIPSEFFETKLIQRILHGGAPKLEELDVGLDSSDVHLIPADKLSMVKRYEFFTEPDSQPANLKFLEAQPKLRELSLHSMDGEFHIPWNIITQFLRLSSETLETLDIDVFSAARIHSVSESLPVLLNLRTFQIRVDRVDLRSENFKSSVAAIDFNRLCPRVSSPEFCMVFDLERYSDEDDEMNDDQHWEPEVIPPPEPNVTGDTSSVKRLSVNGECTLEETVPHLSLMFPNVESLGFRRIKGNLGACLPSWKKLRSVYTELRADGPEWTEEFDSVFCGITPEETKLLRGMDDEYLRNVHIVPVRPSLCLLESLEKLSIRLMQQKADKPVTVGLPDWLISKVSSFLVFRHMPQLQVTIQGKDYHQRSPSFDKVLVKGSALALLGGEH